MFIQVRKFYDHLVLGYPVITLILLISILGFFTWHSSNFKLDASADSLLLEDDQDLRYFREITSRYETREFLFVTFTPKADLFSSESLQLIKQLGDELSQLELVESVTSLVNVPLVKQVEGSLSDIAENARNLANDDVDIAKARAELLESPIYRELIISADGQTTAIKVNLKQDKKFRILQNQRDQLTRKRKSEGLSAGEEALLDQVLREYEQRKTELNKANSQNIASIREIIKPYQQHGSIHLGGVPMITEDMITFIKNDLIVFGIGVFLFLVGMLTIIFRQVRWVLLPLLSCLFAGLLMIGLLGLVGWRVTVISSNFISLMLIITMSMNIHLVVRYRQLRKDFPDMGQRELVLNTTCKMVWPCLYTALTTIMAFSSLVVSDIKPVIDFGWMMTIGLTVTFLTSFLLFPALLVLLPKSTEPSSQGGEFQFTTKLAALTERHGGKVLALSILLTVISLVGITRLEVENSFINYFSKSTEIYQGLKLIDEKLGGTTPLDIILKLEEPEQEEAAATEGDELDDLFGSFEDESEDVWFTPDRLDTIKKVHDYLDGIPAVGKVLSLASIIRVGEDLNEGEFDAFELAIVYKRMPPELKTAMIDPYISVEHNEARINLRILDSLKDLRRKELIDNIRSDLTNKLDLTPDQFKITGILVLYNNMLQSLFRSQILTLGVVMVGIAIMLLVLFRSVSLAIIGIIPNLLAAAIILGLMGLLDIPLDMMTITIAAITIGIAVDNSIHYLYRFREEYPKFRDYTETLYYCHANIGKAVFYTAITIIIGFSILVLSNFIPTIYFGLLTAMAMFIALLAALTLLPKLILLWKPFK